MNTVISRLSRDCACLNSTAEESGAVQDGRKVACQVSLEDLAPVMHVHESWQQPATDSTRIRSCRCQIFPLVK